MNDHDSSLVQPRDERQFETSFKVQVPGVMLNLSFKRIWDNRADRFATDTATTAGMTLEDLDERISSGGPIANIYLTAGRKAWESGDHYLNDVLARLVAAALLDDARIDTMAYVIDRIVKLEPIHIRIVALFLEWATVEQDANEQAGQDADKKYGLLQDRTLGDGGPSLPPHKIGPILLLDAGIIQSCLQELESVGFVHDRRNKGRYQIAALGLAASKIINDTRDQLASHAHRRTDGTEPPN